MARAERGGAAAIVVAAGRSTRLPGRVAKPWIEVAGRTLVGHVLSALEHADEVDAVVLGVDGLEGVGGSLTAALGGYDDLSHFHVLLQNPRAGVMQLPAFEKGDTTPQPFVPHAMETYMAWRWNMRVFYDRVAALVDQYRHQGSVDEMMEERISEPLGINFQADVLDNIGSRYTWMIGYEKPAHFRGQQHVLAIELLCAVQAANLRAPLELSTPTKAVVELVRSRIPELAKDRWLQPDILEAREMIATGQVTAAAETVVGRLS